MRRFRRFLFNARFRGFQPAHRIGFEFDAITISCRCFAQIPKNINDMFGIRRSDTQQVRILGHPIVLSFPDKEQTRSLENEPVSMGRYAEPIQKALDAIAEKQEIEVFPAGSRMVQKPLENGVADVTPLVRIHMMASK
jgi:hypothetical protein